MEKLEETLQEAAENWQKARMYLYEANKDMKQTIVFSALAIFFNTVSIFVNLAVMLLRVLRQ